MPLPTALQARLQQRGLIKQEETEVKVSPDDKPQRGECPNSWNKFHTCVDYCKERWGANITQEKSNKSKTFEAKPLPPGWFLVPDPKSGHKYYWNVHTNMVSWRHPQDAKADITLPASFQLKKDTNADKEKSAVTGEEDTENRPTEKKIEEKKAPIKVNTGKHPSLLKAQREKDRLNPYKKKQKKDELDPMDPASYSDVPRGNWNSGLREDIDVKTGVDTTANGPLFQQRPYPSPGEVLRRNRQQNPQVK